MNNNPRWLHEIPKGKKIESQRSTIEEKIENKKQLLSILVKSKRLNRTDADKLLQEYIKLLKK